MREPIWVKPRKVLFRMSRKRRRVNQIIGMLGRTDVLLGKGSKVSEVCKQFEITEQFYYQRIS